MNNCLKVTISLLFLLFGVLPPALAQKTSAPRVLVLHSYHKSLSWVESIEQGIISEFKKKELHPAFRFEYMDTKRTNRPDYFQSLFEFYKIKFKNIRFNVIICSDNNALNFLLSNHHVLFPGTPIVFCGINNFKKNILVNQDLFTGSVEEIDFKSTIDIAVKLHPKTRQIIFYGDDSPTYHHNKALLDKLVPEYKNQLKFQYKNNFNITQIRNDIQTLDPNSLILLGTTIRTETGDFLSFKESVKLMEEVSYVPIYGCWDFFLGNGIEGGMLVSGFAQGKTAAGIAICILSGKKAADIPVVMKSPNQYMFDNDQLKKFSVNPSKLPETSVIINKQLSFYAKNKQLVFLIICIIALLAFIIMVLSFNIKSRKRAEKKLEESEVLMRTVIDTIPDFVWLKKQNGVYLLCNSKFERLFGAKESDIIGKTDYDFVDKELADFFRKKDKTAMDAGMLTMNEEEITFADDGHIELVETVKIPMHDFNGKLIGVLGIARDITERKQAEKEKINAQKIAGNNEKLALVGQIAGKMAHDFNNILGIIMGNAELSLLDCKDEETKKTLELIFEQTVRGKNLTKNLVVFAKDQEPKQKFFKFSEKIDLVIDLLRNDLKEIELKKEYKPGVPDLLADPGMIEHALVNLVQNSIHALSMVEQPRIIIRTYCFDDNICFEIEDNGCGIPKKHLKSIYEPSFTLKGTRDVTGSYKSGIKGTGYGMANVKKYIELHKGKISVESKFGFGTKFTISLPVYMKVRPNDCNHRLSKFVVADENDHAPAMPVIKKELTQKEKTELSKPNTQVDQFEKYILLVEDEPSISDVQYQILTQDPCRHKVDIADNGQNAMDLVEKNKYDLVSLDYMLPGKINGMDVYNHVRAVNKSIPILFVSGNIEFLESIKELKQKDANVDHQSKPCKNIKYVNSINKLLERTYPV